MVLVKRWKFTDPFDADPETNNWTVPLNPNEMDSVFPTRAYELRSTVSVDGRKVVFEGQTPPREWTFGGAILNHDHYEGLRLWVYDKPGRVYIDDHFGRRLTVLLQAFEPVPKRDIRRYWRHNYSIRAILLDVGAPTIFDYQQVS